MPGDWDVAQEQALASGWHPLTSSNLSAYSYEPDTRTLKIRFKSGKTYSYDSVPSQVVLDLEAASSPGSYFNQAIKNSFAYQQI